MPRSSRAPLLSATFTIVSCWITSARLLDDLGYAPALLLGQRARLGQADAIAHAAAPLGVVRLQAARVTHHLLVQRVRLGVLDQHDDRAIHLVADDDALT